MPLLAQVAQGFNDALVDTDREAALRVIDHAIAAGLGPEDVVFGVVLPTMEKLMDRDCAGGATSLAQHFLASQISADVVERMLPRFAQAHVSAGTVVIGTSLGDFHGLGKRIVVGCLKARMFDVTDLGMNVPGHRFVDEAVRLNASVIGVSSMMVHTATGAQAATGVRALLKERGLEGRIKLVVGGAPYLFDDTLYRTVGADAWARNGLEAAAVVAGLVREGKP
jgi:methanogenic corrinoid protein MtbC1